MNLRTAIVITSSMVFGMAITGAHAENSGPKYKPVTEDRIIENSTKGAEWLTTGMDYYETHYSPLNKINKSNIKDLGLAWSYDLKSSRGIESTPVVANGIMYVTSNWGVVHAIDAKSGESIWKYDPEVDKGKWGVKACCDAVNRGVALSGDKVYVAAFDGRLIALNASTGKLVWEKDTFDGEEGYYTITGAPRIAGSHVVIGNGGADYSGRGYITSYNVDTGKKEWRWYTVPGNPKEPFENEAMKKAAETWDPAGEWWKNGGGGTVWDSMVYDPELDTLYIGTGNGSPWAAAVRSPAGGDNLYLGSIVAIDPNSGEYKWHYQETPGDNWDYTSVQPIIMADIKIDGKLRKVLLHAPKNGFFYVIDRETGEFISAKNYMDVTWAKGYGQDGRPIEFAAARDTKNEYLQIPGPLGAHNWQPMSYSKDTGLVYIPAQQIPVTYKDQMDWRFKDPKPGVRGSFIGRDEAKTMGSSDAVSEFGELVAWDPVSKKSRWRVRYDAPWNGGVLSTGGDLVFQGTSDGKFIAYDAETGDKLWKFDLNGGAGAGAATYEIDGEQYISIPVGWGGAYGLPRRVAEQHGSGTVYTFKLGGDAVSPGSLQEGTGKLVEGVDYDPSKIELGEKLYTSSCATCHGAPGATKGGALPNLAYVDKNILENLGIFVFKGPFYSLGMPDFTDKLSQDDVSAIKAYIQGTADAIRESGGKKVKDETVH